MSSSIQAAIITLATSVVSLAVGLGAFNGTTAQVLVSAIGPIVGAVAVIVSAITVHGNTVAAAQITAAARGGK
jgi:hypothetical protein